MRNRTLLTAKMVVASLRAFKRLWNEHIAILLHVAGIVLKTTIAERYKNLFFHEMFLHRPVYFQVKK